MSRKLITLLALILIIGLLNIIVVSADAPDGVGAPTMDTGAAGCADDSGSPGTAVVELWARSVADAGAAGFNAMVVYDHSNIALTNVQPGQAFLDLGCNFAMPSTPGTGGDFDFFSGVCTANPGTGALGDFVLAELTFTKTGADGIYAADLVTGLDQWFVNYTSIYDFTADSYFLSDADLTDGEVRFGEECAPTAVELSDFGANSASPAPLALWPLLAGGAAFALGGGLALRRRKR